MEEERSRELQIDNAVLYRLPILELVSGIDPIVTNQGERVDDEVSLYFIRLEDVEWVQSHISEYSDYHDDLLKEQLAVKTKLYQAEIKPIAIVVMKSAKAFGSMDAGR